MAGAAVILGVVVAVARSGGEVPAGSAVNSSASGPLTESGAPLRTGRNVAPGALQSISRVSNTARLENGKPIVFFMGAQFCPFCAPDRWAFVKATSRFGTWTNLRSLHSRAGTDGFDSLPTYDLVDASYQSDLLSLHHKEIADAVGNSLQPLAGVEQDFVNQFDPQGGFPFTIGHFWALARTRRRCRAGTGMGPRVSGRSRRVDYDAD